jgi:hypothetical protein
MPKGLALLESNGLHEVGPISIMLTTEEAITNGLVPKCKGEKFVSNEPLFFKVHSHLMFKSASSENLGGILGGTQC